MDIYGCIIFIAFALFKFCCLNIKQHIYQLIMNLGLSVILFLVIGAVVMALFCLVTRYFNKKLQKAMDDQNEVYSMIQQIKGKGQNQDQNENEYENYVNKKENDNMRKQTHENFQLQMTEVKQPLKAFENQQFGNGRLKKRLDGDSIPLNPETGRSKNSLRSFRPEKLDSLRKLNQSNTNRSNISEEPLSAANSSNVPELTGKKGPRYRKDKKNQVVYHKFISKIVCYIQQGIFIVENNLISISKGSEITEKRNTKNSSVKPEQRSFPDTLEAYGFEKGTFCAYKFESTLEIPHMKQNEEYPVSSLKCTESKSEIQFPEFYELKDKLQEN